ncbi:amino acid adenylation domain-containing protein [Pseudoalteromonas luteoviolacea]|uniref:non-ribosomal peptide synthetase n=1 Tax=Pseudoalteromonas luteoviolacea TaxID=43657 RepID=UPI001B358918|nr:non-ribosomal peptide synthetase [Pseudoalteromonas luteoviolacea]MBQ4814054.1 amino acid adenylation domain-containing protein [Pseudoalteromonas luteoviolacea]
MKIEALFNQASKAGVYFYLEQNKLKFRAKKGAFSDELKAQVKARKDELHAYLSTLESTESSSALVKSKAPNITPVSRQGDLPMSFSQQRLWFIEQLEGQTPQYNIPAAFHISGELDVAVVERAISTIIERHEVLRTNYAGFEEAFDHEVSEQVMQTIREQFVVPLSVIDLSQEETAAQQQQIAQYVNDDAVKPFNLESDVLLRVTLIKVSEQEHVALFNMHHIASDGWSMGIVVKEFSALYSAYSSGQDNPLSALSIQYADYAAWQRNWLQGEVLASHLAYWKQQLANLPTLHSLPLDKPRPALQTFEGGSVNRFISAPLSNKIQDFCQKQNVTLFMFLHSAYSLLLSQFSGESDIVIGTPVAGRDHQNTEGLIGFFVNTLVLRSNVGVEQSFADYLQGNKQTIIDAYANQQLPFETLVEHLSPARSIAHAPLVQVSINLRKKESTGLNLAGLTLSKIEQSQETTPYELTLNIDETDTGLSLGWKYNSNLFNADSVTEMAISFEQLLEQAIDNAQENVKAIRLLTSQQQAHLNTFTEGEQSQADNTSFIAHTAHHAAQNPHAIAATCQDQTLTYQQLDLASSVLAKELMLHNVKAGDAVGICMARSVDMLTSIVAIHKLGAAFVPLDPELPISRLEFMAKDAQTQCIVTDEFTRTIAEQVSGERLIIVDDISQHPSESSALPAGEVNPSDCAYIIYTSGSTGQPKGVEITHGGLSNYLSHAVDTYLPAHISGTVMSTTLAFDATITSLLAPLYCGKSVEILPSDEQLLDNLAQRISATDASLMFKLTPAHMDALQHQPSMQKNDTAKHVLVIGGEQLLTSTIVEWRDNWLPNSTYVNEYGPTETVVGCSIHTITPECPLEQQQEAAVSIGKPIRNTSLYVMNSEHQPLPIGAIGELYIGGAGVALGYRNRDELTAAQFIEYTDGGASQRLYRTGDLVRWTHQGTLQFIGRNDEQIKLRGYRIEIGEIENTLNAAEFVKESAVNLCHLDTGAHLVSYIVAAQSDALSDEQKASYTERLKQYLQAHLPAYMVPEIYIYLDTLPLTNNGKVDRRALPLPSSALSSHEYVAPSSDLEQQLCELWQDVLKLDRVGVTDNFFALGGHSLMGTRLISLIRNQLGVEASVRALFEHPTIAEFAANIGALSTEQVLPDIVPVQGNEPLPLSYAQQRLWFIDQMNSGSAQYNMPGAFQLDGQLDINAFEQAVMEVINRHDVLRTSFTSIDGDAQQFIQQNVSLPLTYVDLCELTEADQQAEIAKRIKQDAGLTFDLRKDTLIRLQLIKLNDTRHVVMFNMHHIASDGWSSGVLINEFSELYSAFTQGKPSPLADLKIQYADYAVWQREWLQGEVLEQHLGYWKDTLAGLPEVHNLPLDKQRPTAQKFVGKSFAQHLSNPLRTKLNKYCQSEDVTLFMLLESAFAALISRYSGESDIVIGTAISGRVHKDLEPLIGFFINDLVLRTQVDDKQSFKALLAQNKQTILDAYAHQYVPFEMLVEALSPERHLRHNPIVQIKLDLQNNEQVNLSLPNVELSPVQMENNISRYDLYLSVTETDNGLELDWRYSTELFFDETIANIAQSFATLLNRVVDASECALGELNILDEQQQNTLLTDWNDSDRDYPVGQCLHQIFERQAQLTPDNIAVKYGAESITYKELNEQSNQLAHHLISIGVKPDSLVGLCVERSIEMFIGIFGILKSGGAYVPLDPSYPQDRLTYMLEDSDVDVVVTDSELMSLLELDDRSIVLLDEGMRDMMLGKYSTQDPDPDALGITPNNLIYVIYTSGSTGKPKGVLVEHHSVVNFLYYSAEAFLPDHVEGALVSAPLAFDGTVCTLYTAFFEGKYTELLTASDTDIDQLAKYVFDANKPLLMKLTPAHLEALLAQKEEDDQGDVCTAQHTFVIAGELLTEKNLANWRDKLLPNSQFFNEYGPTEASVGTTVYPANTGYEVPSPSAGVPIGKPLGNAKLYVLNECRQLQPVGVIGELYIGGAGIARGYYKQPQMTDDKFIPDHFTQAADKRLYKTGDLVRWLPDGNIEFVGRVDNQVKLRGFRIELSEIEKHLSAIPGIQESVVVCRDDEGFDKRLVAYLISSEELEQDDEDVLAEQKLALVNRYIDTLKAHLPSYMVPNIFVFMEKFPLSPNGKVNRKGLPMPKEGDLQKTDYVAPRNDTEQQLCEIWQTVLQVDQLSIYDDFFTLGGHSLLATRLISQIRKDIGVDVSVQLLFEQPTIAGFAESMMAFGDAEKLPPINKLDRSKPLPLSFSQQRIWFVEQLESEFGQYNMASAYHMRGQLDLNAFTEAVRRTVARHEILRTTFDTVDGDAVQIAHAEFEPPVFTLDLSHLDAQAQQQAAEEAQREDSVRPFDLTQELPFRVTLLLLSEQEYILQFNMHHIVSDGWSTGIWTAEFAHNYHAVLAGEPLSIDESEIQYADFAQWQRDYLQGDVLSEHLEYWAQQLTDAPAVHQLPMDFQRPEKPTYQGKVLAQRLDTALSEKLAGFAKEQGVTMFTLMHALFSAYMARKSHQTDVVVGTPVANRLQPETERLIGCFVNTVVLRTTCTPSDTFVDYLQGVKATNNEAQTHQALPFEQLVEQLQIPRNTQHSPLFQVMLSMNTNEQTQLALSELSLTPILSEEMPAKFDLTLDVRDNRDGQGNTSGVDLTWIYDKALFKEETIQTFNTDFVAMLEHVLSAPTAKLAELAINSESQVNATLLENVARGTDSPETLTLAHDLVRLQASKTPDAIAVQCSKESLTYKELDEESTQLANYLLAQNVDNEELVGLALDRSCRMIVAVLAVAKAGKAYIPLDPNYPQAMLDHIVADSRLSLLLTQSSLRTLVDEEQLHRVFIDEISEALSKHSKEQLTRETSSHSELSHVIYTSGSTGKPKGVMIERGNVAALVAWSLNAFSAEQTQVVLASTSLCFDLSVFEMYAPLCRGGKVQLVDNILAFSSLTNAAEVTLINTVPSAIRALLDTQAQLGGVHTVNSAGELLHQHIVDALYDCGVHVVNDLYGPSEDTTYSTWCTRQKEGKNTIGQAIEGSYAWVLDEFMQPVPAGTVGELYLSGAGVSRGYLNNPELTAQRYLNLEIAGTPVGRAYRTGDFVQYDQDNNLQYIGRIDEQVKIRGFRIELTVIEQALRQHHHVNVVCVRTNPQNDSQLVAYIQPKEGDEALNQAELLTELRAQIAQSLPGYMAPSHYVFLEAMPLNSNGKIDKSSLPAPSIETHVDVQELPETEIECQLAAIWADLLQQDATKLSIHSNFFEIGGHSLMMVRLLSKIKEHFSIELGLQDIYTEPTIANMAIAIALITGQVSEDHANNPAKEEIEW